MDNTKYFLGENVEFRFEKIYLYDDDLNDSVVYTDDVPYIKLRAPGCYIKMTVIFAGDITNAKCVYMTKKEAKAIRKALKTMYKKKR